MYDPYILTRIHDEQARRERRVDVPRSRRRSPRSAARLSSLTSGLHGRRTAEPAPC